MRNDVAGDLNSIRVGAETNIQDHSLIHVAATRLSGGNSPTIIGDKVTIGGYSQGPSTGNTKQEKATLSKSCPKPYPLPRIFL